MTELWGMVKELEPGEKLNSGYVARAMKNTCVDVFRKEIRNGRVLQPYMTEASYGAQADERPYWEAIDPGQGGIDPVEEAHYRDVVERVRMSLLPSDVPIFDLYATPTEDVAQAIEMRLEGEGLRRHRGYLSVPVELAAKLLKRTCSEIYKALTRIRRSLRAICGAAADRAWKQQAEISSQI